MREVTRQSILSLAIAAAALFVTACAGSQAASLTAPSGTAATTAAPGSNIVIGATISGTVVGAATSLGAGHVNALGGPMTVIVTGTATSSTVDSSGHFALQNVSAGHVDLHFTGNGTDAHLGLDNVVEHGVIAIAVIVNGSIAELDHGQQDGPDNTVEIEGLVTSTSVSTLTVNGKLITTAPSTVIVHGDQTVAFASIKSGDRVHVKGTSTTAGALAAVLATKIEVQSIAPVVTPPATTPPTTTPTPPAATPAAPGESDGKDDGSGDKNEAEASGTLAGKTGACPAISFKIGTTSVTTSAATVFKGATCVEIANGTKVEIKGTKQTSGVLLAGNVQVDK